MKLPEYDNRPAPGAPLYEDNESSEWDNIKFPLLAIALPILLLLLFGSAAINFAGALFR